MANGNDGEREEIIVRRSTRMPQESRAAEATKMSVFWLLVLGIILTGMVLLIVYKDVLVPPRPVGDSPGNGRQAGGGTQGNAGREAPPPVSAGNASSGNSGESETDAEEWKLPVTPKELERDRIHALQLVQKRQADPDYLLNLEEQMAIQRNWVHVIDGCTPEETQRMLDLLDMCYAEDGSVRNLTFEELAQRDKKKDKKGGKSPLRVGLMDGK